MKKLIIFLTAFCLFSACAGMGEAAGRRETVMGHISWDDRAVQLDLHANLSTGFEWLTVYQSENLATGSRKYQGTDNNKEATSGGPGRDHLNFTVTDGKDAYLVLKYARPWKDGEVGTYHSYIIKTENGKISEVTCKERAFHKDFEFVVTKRDRKRDGTGDGLRFVASVPKDWDYGEEGLPELKVRPKGQETYCRVGYVPDMAPGGTGDNGKKIKISDKEYTLILSGNGDMVLSDGGHICWTGKNADWQAEYFLDIVTILDTADYWE